MHKKHRSLSPQEIKRLQGGEMILHELEDDDITIALEVSLSSVRNWRRVLKKQNNDLNSLVRKTGFGFMTMSPKQQRLHFRFTIFDGAITLMDIPMISRQIHDDYGKPVMILWDRFPLPIAAQNHFMREHPDSIFICPFCFCEAGIQVQNRLSPNGKRATVLCSQCRSLLL